MSDRITVRAKRLAKATGIEILVRHASRRPLRHDRASAPVPEESVIEHMSFQLNDAVVAEVFIGALIAFAPLTIIELDDVAPGDVINVDWHGPAGEFASESVRFDAR
ncbi:MAG: thiosulfate oxidation carrier complex protein SoxZ [Hyphomicrobiaceae bacterium]